jgi:RHS repeat-associated protein
LRSRGRSRSGPPSEFDRLNRRKFYGWNVPYKPHDGSAAPVTNAIQKTQLTGLGSNEERGTKNQEQISIDLLGNQTLSRTFVDPATRTVTQTTLYSDSTNAATQVSVNGLARYSISKTGVRTDAGYDALGRHISARVDAASPPRSVGSVTHYNTLGQVDWVADALTNITRFSYCPTTGRRISVTDALSNTTYTAYDPEGRVIATWGATYPVAYAYDAYGRMVVMATFRVEGGAGDQTQWLYDEATGLLTNKVYADGKGPSYTYTPDGQIATRTWTRGVTTTYSYTNTTGELIGIDYSDATPDVTFAYDRLGRQSGVMDAQGSRTYGYDPFTLAVSHETMMAGGVTSVIARTYDTQGRAIRLTFDDDYAAGYGFDALGRFCRLSSVIGGSSSNTWQYSYLPDSGLISGWSNGILSTVKSYEAHRNLLTGVQNLANGVAISTYRYSNDVLGRRTQRIDTTASAMTNAFAYNIRSELTNAVMGAHSFGWAFDAIGNRQTHTANGSNRTYLANALNQYTNITAGTVQVPQYDLDGNLIFLPSTSGGGAGGEGWYLQWNGENRLQGASNGSTIVAFQYDHMGRRFSKSVNGVTNLFYYDAWNVIAEKSAGAFTCHIWGPDLSGSMQGAGGIGGLLATHASGNLYFACVDGNGNVTEYTDATGTNAVARYCYGAYGELLEVSGINASDFHILFSSKYLDRETAVSECPGWYYYGYRYLWDGRWMSRDPIGERGGENLYAFIKNTVNNQFDYLGLSCCVLAWTKNGLPGHAALQCDNGVYISKYPDKSKNKLLPQPPSWKTPDYDNKHLNGEPDVKICLDCLDESAISKWFFSKDVQTDEYFWPNPNCVGAVLGGIIAGITGDKQNKPEIATCPCPTFMQALFGGCQKTVKDILDPGLLALPGDLAEMIEEFKKNKCNRYRCSIQCSPPQAIK